MRESISIHTENGEIEGVKITSQSKFDMIVHSVSQSSNFDDNLLNDFLIALEQEYTNITFVSRLLVNSESRGKGHGSNLLDEFMSLTSDSDIKFLFARVGNSYSNGFCLESFYKKRGFEGFQYSNGELLMISSKHIPYFNSTLKGDINV